MVCIDIARQMARELVSNGCGAHAILSQLYADFDGFRFYEHKHKIWMEGDDTFVPPTLLCALPKKVW